MAAGMASTGSGWCCWHGPKAGRSFFAALIGLGSSIFHPEASRTPARRRMRPGFAQSLFQSGQCRRPSPLGGGLRGDAARPAFNRMVRRPALAEWRSSGGGRVWWWCLPMPVPAHAATPCPRDCSSGIILLILLMISKLPTRLASSYFIFYLIEQYGPTVGQSQMCSSSSRLVAVGTIIGGPIGTGSGGGDPVVDPGTSADPCWCPPRCRWCPR
jgi:FSR family fosmidomycin resistance protein-like MFS transporter